MIKLYIIAAVLLAAGIALRWATKKMRQEVDKHDPRASTGH